MNAEILIPLHKTLTSYTCILCVCFQSYLLLNLSNNNFYSRYLLHLCHLNKTKCTLCV